MSDVENDIAKYCKGEMTPAEMHALEKRALSDPFLADALEGAQAVQIEFSNDLESLRSGLERRTRPAVSLWVWSSRIAAGVAVVALATFVLVSRSSRKENLALNTPQVDSQAMADHVPGETTDTTENAFQANDVDEVSLPEIRKKARTVPPMIAQKEEEPIEAEIIIPEPFALSETKPAAARTNAEARSKNMIKGYVVDSEDGKGLPGVNVTVKGTGIGTITDEEGNYQIPVDSLNSGLVFSYIGFESKEIVPGTINEVNVALDPDVSELSEVVVVGYGEARDPSEIQPTTIEIASPAGGKKAYKQYLEQNLRYPEQALNHKVEGKVTVQFTLESNGSMTDFKVVKGLGFGCDDEVIRLIRQGPKWRPTKRNHEAVRDRVKVRLRFSLPKDKK